MVKSILHKQSTAETIPLVGAWTYLEGELKCNFRAFLRPAEILNNLTDKK